MNYDASISYDWLDKQSISVTFAKENDCTFFSYI